VSDLLCLIPARGGSKQVRRKNLRTVGGRTLVEIAIRACAPHGRVVCSTDDQDIAAVARMCGAEVWERPAALAADSASIDDLVRHTRTTYAGALLVYQPTVPQAACVLAAFIEWARTRTYGTAISSPHRHIMWNGNGVVPLVEREQRQTVRPLLDEIGVRYYPEGDSTLLAVWPSPLPLVDIDTPADLAQVRAGASSKRILFRVVANRQVGSGHVRRCVQIADELQHHSIAFALVEGSDPDLVGSLCGGYPVVPEWQMADLIVNDRLDCPLGEMLRLRFVAPVIALEDSGPATTHASLVINELYPAAGNCLSGPEWAVLRPVFTAVPSHRFDHGGKPRLLVTFGGTDPSQLSERLRRLTSKYQTVDWDVVVVDPPGAGKGVDLAGLLVWADLVVCSGGRTVWEAMACGTPALVLCQNPRELSHSHLSPAFGVLNLGLGKLVDDDRLFRHLTVLLNDPVLLADMSARMRGIVDGRGVLRIAHRIEGLLGGL
jgi:spore coat polysaccharide biosynthesis predicted glycosyltransferase SpsG